MRYAIRCEDGTYICCQACFERVKAQLKPDASDVANTEDDPPCMGCELQPVIDEADRQIVRRLVQFTEAVLVLYQGDGTFDQLNKWNELTEGAPFSTKGLCARARQLGTEADVLGAK